MKKTFFPLLLFVIALVPAGLNAQKTDPDGLFRAVRARILSVKDYRAEVSMRIDVPFMRVPPMNGTLYFKSPDKMRLERKGGISILPKKDLSLSLGNLLPEGGVTVIDAGTELVKGSSTRILKVIPDSDNGDIVLAKLWIDEARLLAVKTETATRENGTVKMELEYGKYLSYGLPDMITMHLDLKDYKLPKGVAMDYEESIDQEMLQKAKKSKSSKGKIQITYLDYKINTGLSDAFFRDKKG